MAYKRIPTQDGVTKMNKVLYDNLQDGIDELKKEKLDISQGSENYRKIVTVGADGNLTLSDELPGNSVLISSEIPSAQWTGDSPPYNARIEVPEITGDPKELIEVFIPNTASYEEKLSWMEIGVISALNESGSLTFEALFGKPSINIPISILKRGDLGDSPSSTCNCTSITKEQIEEVMEGGDPIDPSPPSDCGCTSIPEEDVIEVAEN